MADCILKGLRMDRNFARALSCVLKDEGGWADDPHDPGGATMKGVTLATFRRYVEPTATKDDLRKITNAQLTNIYKRQYWNAVKGDDLPDGVDYAVFDFAVNSGQARAAKYLQTIVGVTADGKIGPQTLAAVKATDSGAVINMLCDRRLDFLQGLPTWPRYKNGWTDRVHGVREVALEMVASAAPTPVPSPPAPIDANKTAGMPVPPRVPAPTPENSAGGKGLAVGVAGILVFVAAFWATVEGWWAHAISFIERIF
jgi:lysozyme family protein